MKKPIRRQGLRLMLVILFAFIFSTGSVFAAKPQTETLGFKSEEMGFSIQYPASWSVAPGFYSNQLKLVNVPANAQAQGRATSAVKVFVEDRLDHEDAVMRLQHIARGMDAPESAFFEVEGWPAVQYGQMLDRPKPSKATGVEDKRMYVISTVIAAGNQVIRSQGILPSSAGENLKSEARFIGRGLKLKTKGNIEKTRERLQQLRANSKAHQKAKVSTTAESIDGAGNLGAVLESFTSHADIAEGFNQRILMTGFGEVEIAVSPDAQNVVIGRQGDWVASNDGGQSFPFGGTVGAFDGGDPSVAWAQSGAFYYAGIDRGCQAGSDCTGMAQSLDNGQTFNLVSPAVVCPTRGQPDNSGCFPDQEHIAADAFNAGSTGGDQVYSVWRNFDDLGAQDPAIVCSEDSGQTWTAPAVIDNPSGSSFPRVGVGSDGSVYVAYYDGSNYELRKYSSCANGLVPQPIVTVATRTAVECPFAGHDRCDQNPTSQMVVVDDTNPNHVYYAYGQNQSAGTDNIFVRDSLDGGATWPAGRVIQANAPIPGSRIMPWICASEGQAYVTWYDRRAAPPNQNDLTDFYGARIGLDGLGNLVTEEEFRISEVGDPWCASGWPCGTRGAPGASENCSVQPQLAGWCGTSPPYTNTRCDFSDCGGVGNNGGGACQCLNGDVCNAGSRQGNAGGCPKYGDYNGNACMAGRLYAAWASATSPPAVPLPNPGRIGMLFDFFLLGDVSQIQVPNAIDFGALCSNDGVATETLEVCNTGNSNLLIESIVSDNGNFSITDPSGGYPVAISPDFCFPFQASYDPVALGPASATLTINSNDPATPEIMVTADANVAEQNIVTVMNTDFGEICLGDTAKQQVTIMNDGACDLTVSDVSITNDPGNEFNLATILSTPFRLKSGESISADVEFAPAGATGAASADLEIDSDDPDTLTRTLDLSGNSPSAAISTSLADSGSFGQLCDGEFHDLNLTIQSTGSCDLALDSVVLSGTDLADFQLPNGSPAGTIIEAGNQLIVPVRFAPENTSDGNPRTASVDVQSSTKNGESLTLDQTAITGTTGLASVITFISDSGDFGNVCADTIKDMNMTIQSNGSCALAIDSLTLSGIDVADFLLPNGSLASTIIEPGNSLLVPIRFTPTNFGDPTPRTASIDLASHTPGGDALALNQTPIAGTVPPPDINVAIADSGEFGNVCKTEHADLNLTLFNQGLCNLTISSITSDNGLFELPTDITYPLVLSHDADFNFPVRYAPTECSDLPDVGTLTINNDSPGEEVLKVGVQGNAPCPNLVIDPVGLTGDFAFPATVADPNDTLGCYSEETAILRNSGLCPLTIDSITAASPGEFTVMAPREFPITLPTGEETLGVTVRFTPQSLGDPLAPDEFTGQLTILSDDPDATGLADLCGEGVAQSGLRVLTTDISSGVPIIVEGVDNVTIRSKGKKTPSPVHLQFTDVDSQSATICGNIVRWHVDQETLPNTQTTGSNPKSSYQVSAKEGNLQDSQSFSLGQCDFLEFQLQFQDSDSPICLLAPKGAACTTDGECCSGKCKGPTGGKSCK